MAPGSKESDFVEESSEDLRDKIVNLLRNHQGETMPRNTSLNTIYPGVSANLLKYFTKLGISVGSLTPQSSSPPADLISLIGPAVDLEHGNNHAKTICTLKGGASISLHQVEANLPETPTTDNENGYDLRECSNFSQSDESASFQLNSSCQLEALECDMGSEKSESDSGTDFVCSDDEEIQDHETGHQNQDSEESDVSSQENDQQVFTDQQNGQGDGIVIVQENDQLDLDATGLEDEQSKVIAGNENEQPAGESSKILKRGSKRPNHAATTFDPSELIRRFKQAKIDQNFVLELVNMF